MIRAFRLRGRSVGVKSGGSSRASLLLDTSVVMLVMVISRGVLALVMVAAANFLTIAQFTAYNYFMITTSLVSAVLGLGLPTAAIRVTAESTPDKAPDFHQLIATIWWGFALGALGLVLAAPLILPQMAAEGVQVSETLLIIGAVALAGGGICNGAMQGAGAFKATLPPAILGTIALLGGCLWAWSVGSERPLLIGVILFYILPAALYLVHLRRLGFISFKAVFRLPTASTVRNVSDTALPTLGTAAIFTGINWWLASSLLDHQTSPDAFAHFAIGMQWFSLASVLPLALSSAILPRYIQLAKSSAMPIRVVLRPALITFGLVLALTVVAILMTPLLSIIYGRNFQFSVLFVMLIMLTAAFSATAGVIGQSIIAFHGAATWLKTFLVFLVVGLAVPFLWPTRNEVIAAATLGLINVALLGAALATILLARRRRSREAALGET